MGKSAGGAGNIRKKTITRDGKQYTYWEARLTVGYDSGTGNRSLDPSLVRHRKKSGRRCSRRQYPLPTAHIKNLPK